jgi:carbamoyltransferase
LGLVYEELTAHLGFRRSSDEYKVMALAAYGEPRWLEDLQQVMAAKGDGGFRARSPEWAAFAPPRRRGEPMLAAHADLACSVQRCLEGVLVDLAGWLAATTGSRHLAMAGGVALNCVANSAIHRSGVFDDVWVQPASGDSGTALGAALAVAAQAGDRITPMKAAALGRGWDDDQLAAVLTRTRTPFDTPTSIAEPAARILADGGIVGWVQGRAEYGPRALGHRSMLADPRDPATRDRMNDVKGREEFRPVAPVVLADRAAEVFDDGPLPSPFMLFTHRVRPEWADRIPGALHVDGTARIQTVERDSAFGQLLAAFESATGVPVVVNTSLNTAGRPIVDTPEDALECFASSPMDALVLGGHLVRRAQWP